MANALPHAIKAVRELAKPAIQDRLVASLKRYRQIPKLTWRQRRRLTKVIGSEAAEYSLMDQDPAALAEVVAKALREPAAGLPRAVAEALIAEYPGCVDGAQQAIVLAYQLRLVRQAVDAHDQQLDGIGQTVADLYRMSMSDPGRIDPEVLLNGPLDGLKLHADYQRVRELAGSDSAAAAEQLSTMIDRIEDANYPLLTRRFRRELADLLAEAGQYERAADAWLPMVEDSLTGGFGFGHIDACNSWEAMLTCNGAPRWLANRRAVVIVLDHCIMGDRSAASAMEVAVATANAGDPAGPVWLMHAAEACLTDDDAAVIKEHQQQLLAAAAAAVEPMVAARLHLAVADATGNEDLWQQLLATTVPGSPGTPSEVAALISARRGRELFQEGQLAEAVTSYRTAAGRGSQVQNWQDAANWAASASVALKQTEAIDLAALSSLSEQESALRDAGPGSLLTIGYDMRGSAAEKLLEIASGNSNRARTARIDLRRYLRRAIVLGEINNELDAHALLSQMYLPLGDVGAALGHALASGDVTRAGAAAAELDSYYECFAAAQSPVPNIRAAGLHAAFRQADLIPDDQVASWARAALNDAKALTTAAMGADPYVQAYNTLRGLSNRFPDDLVPELLGLIAGRLPDNYALLSAQIAHILIGLGRHSRRHEARVADLIATAFEDADDIAYDISDAARSLAAPLTLVADRLRALLAPGEYRLGRRSAALTLAVIGDRSPQFVEYADSAVAEQLPDPATGRPAGSPGNCEDAALLAAALPMERRVELARYCGTRVADSSADEEIRTMYANACRLAADGLPAEIRAELFDQLFPQQLPSESHHPKDVARRQFESPFSFIRMTTHSTEQLRRHIAKALAVLATDLDRQGRLWRATQQIAMSGSAIDVSTVGDIGFALAKAGYAAELPWEAMACSSDAKMRQLAAALIPYMREVDPDLVTNLAGDPKTPVRRELAQTIVNIRNNPSGDETSSHSEWVDPVVELLRGDPSYHVRQTLNW